MDEQYEGTENRQNEADDGVWMKDDAGHDIHETDEMAIEQQAEDIAAILMGEDPDKAQETAEEILEEVEGMQGKLPKHEEPDGTEGGGTKEEMEQREQGDKDDSAHDGETESEDSEEDATEQEATEDELAADGLPKAKNDRTNNRIKQLVDRAKAAEAAAADAERRASEAERLSAISTDAHPDPDKELADLRSEYGRIKSAAQLISEGIENPLTGEPYTPAEAQAAIAEYKQDLQFRISEVERATVDRMQEAQTSQANADDLRNSLVPFLQKHPELDPDSTDADPDMIDLLKARIDTSAIQNRGMLTGWKTPPAEIVAQFERFLTRQNTLKVNQKEKADKKIEQSPSRSNPNQATNSKEKKAEDELMAFFDEAMGDMGLKGR